jgi:hypothetical protein
MLILIVAFQIGSRKLRKQLHKPGEEMPPTVWAMRYYVRRWCMSVFFYLVFIVMFIMKWVPASEPSGASAENCPVKRPQLARAEGPRASRTSLTRASRTSLTRARSHAAPGLPTRTPSTGATGPASFTTRSRSCVRFTLAETRPHFESLTPARTQTSLT